ncbi:Putative two-component membrane permease complex subunit SMU_747c [Pontiella desulfatans]|uniref:Two-component membrane permease complex subunit SMU_747c n=1 Tax=Pontiella desulfatans TaxID=2750659 RepID=A0A6C2UBG6_PONDE|nr:permease [Pontiella desulfatans]VGO17385.1 Putative two-component membrane permease complex subunit SMU_747c [Pontiella desulfatans]
MFNWLDNLMTLLVENGFHLSRETHVGESVHFFFYDTVKILILLSVMIFLISYLRTFFQPQKTKALLEKIHGPKAHVAASLMGIITPFCSCSSVPIFIGFIEAGIPLGVTFSFLVTSPIVNEAAFAVLWAAFGWKVAFTYAGMGVVIGVVSGMIIGRFKPEGHLEEEVFNGEGFNKTKPDMTQKERLAYAGEHVREIIKKVWIYLLVGIAIGAAIHGWAPEEILAKYAGSDNPLSVVIAVLCGVPLYANALGTIPIAEALIGKGVGLGTALAFMMAVTALSVPEMVLLRKVMKPRLIAIFVATASIGILIVGWMFNLLF